VSGQFTRMVSGVRRLLGAQWLRLTCALCVAFGVASAAQAQQYTRVSVSSSGAQSNGSSSGAVLRGDGRVVAFTSSASNLVTDDTNGVPDVFLRDLSAHTTTRVSIATDGTERTGSSGLGTPSPITSLHAAVGPQASLSYDASIFAFSTNAAFDPNDTNSCPLRGDGTHNCSDIYIRDRTLNQTTV
jgi:hypothetical protein